MKSTTQPGSKKIKLGIAGASTLLGREIKSVLTERHLPVEKLILMDDVDEIGHLTEFDGEPLVSLSLTPENLEGLDALFFAGETGLARKSAELALKMGVFFIDLSQGWAEDPMVPLNGPEGTSQLPGLAGKSPIVCVPHDAASTLATILQSLQTLGPLQHSSATLFLPASEQGNAGLHELEHQTRNVFTFQPLPQEVFDGQLAFNLLSSLGAEAKVNLESLETRLARQLHRLLGTTVPLPALRVVQAPVFHSHCFSIYAEFEQDVTSRQIYSVLQAGHIQVVEEGDEPPSPVRVAGNDQIEAAYPRHDCLQPNGWWIWAVSDHLRRTALQGVRVMEEHCFE